VSESSARRPPGGRWNRPELQRLLDHLRKGDVLVVWKLDRLSRSLRDVLTIMERIQEAKAGFRSLPEAIDTTTPAGRMMMQMIGSFAEFERAMLRERTRGIGVRPWRGPYRRPPSKAAASATDRGAQDGDTGEEDRSGCSSTLQCSSRNHRAAACTGKRRCR
jgi:DNA invertase Pin-like site-specific DNA recombinase